MLSLKATYSGSQALDLKALIQEEEEEEEENLFKEEEEIHYWWRLARPWLRAGDMRECEHQVRAPTGRKWSGLLRLFALFARPFHVQAWMQAVLSCFSKCSPRNEHLL